MASDGSAKVAQVMWHEEHVRSVSVLRTFRLSIPVFFYPGKVFVQFRRVALLFVKDSIRSPRGEIVRSIISIGKKEVIFQRV
jgi:hypothetical protein